MQNKEFIKELKIKKIFGYNIKHLIIVLIVLALLVSVGAGYLISNIFPKYQTIRSLVGEFSSNNVLLSILIDGEKKDSFPTKESGYIFDSLNCKKSTTGVWDNENWELQLTFNETDSCTISFIEAPLFTDYIKSLYDPESEGTNDLYYHDGQGTYTNADQEAGDNSYRYSGNNPNNYVCFGSQSVKCPLNNLYRIVGVFENNIKVVKYQSQDSIQWSYTDYIENPSMGPGLWPSNYTNDWKISNIKDELNNNFLDSFDITWKNKIATHTWKIGGVPNLDKPKVIYENEIGSKSNNLTDDTKIGLIYLSDYAYAASSEYWQYTIGESNEGKDYTLAKDSNWLSSNYDYYWIISPDSSSSIWEYICKDSCSFATSHLSYTAYPAFYLVDNVKYMGGIGTQTNPYIIN